MDPISIVIAGALAKEAVSGGAKALGKLVQFVKEKFRSDPGAEVVLATAQENPDDTRWVDTLAKVLDRTGEADPAFAAELRELWIAAKTEITSITVDQSVHNTMTGNIHGLVVQAGRISGDIKGPGGRH